MEKFEKKSKKLEIKNFLFLVFVQIADQNNFQKNFHSPMAGQLGGIADFC